MSQQLYQRIREAVGHDRQPAYGAARIHGLTEVMHAAGLNFAAMHDMFRQETVIAAFLANRGNQLAAAHWLGMHRNTFSRHFQSWLRQHNIRGEGSKRPRLAQAVAGVCRMDAERRAYQ